MQRLPAAEPVNEATIGEVLYAPADCEPDLLVVLGEPTRLPPSIVWELAYGELVFMPLGWQELSTDHLVEAIADFEGVWPDRPVVRLPDAGHFCQEDVPDTLVALIDQFVQSNG